MGNSFLSRNMTVVIGLIIAALAVSFATLSYRQLKQEIRKTDALVAEIEKVQAEKTAILGKIEELKEERNSINNNLRIYSENAKLLRNDIDKLSNEKQALSEEFNRKEKVFSELNSKLSSVMRQEEDLKSQLQETKSEHQKKVEELDALRSKKADLENQLKDSLSAPGGVELRKIVVKVNPVIEGEILEINREYSFYIINLGSKDGIKNSATLGIYRDGALVAEAVVENVYEDMSSIIVPDDWADVQVSIGDKVQPLSS